MKHKNFFIVPNQIFELGLKPKAFLSIAVYSGTAIRTPTTVFRHDGSSQTSAAWIRKRLTLLSKSLKHDDLSRRCADTERTVLGQAICTTLHRSWNSVEFSCGWLQIFVPIRRLK